MPLSHLIALIINAHPTRQQARRSFLRTVRQVGQLIRKTSLLRTVPMACGQAANRRHWHHNLVVSRFSSRTILVAFPMLGVCASVATLRHDRLSERSYLFTMSDTTRPQGALRLDDGRGIVVRRTSLVSFKPAFVQSSRFEIRFDPTIETNDPDWWSQTGSNRRPPACKAGALPTELWPLQGSAIRNQSSEKRAPFDA